MARVAGKDVLLELMAAVKHLNESQARQDEDLERIGLRLGLMSERMSAFAEETSAFDEKVKSLATQVQSLATQVQSLATQVGSLAGDVGHFDGRVHELAEDQRALREDFVRLAAHGRETGTGLKRLTDLLLRALSADADRFDELEARLARLEKKTG